eukprot:COSAG02_NODE_5291_length_4468_cov_358.403525_1_plen_72_part_00
MQRVVAQETKYVLAVDTATEKLEWLAVLRENIAVASGKRSQTTISRDKQAHTHTHTQRERERERERERVSE